MGYDFTDLVIPLKGLSPTEKLVLINLAWRAANESDTVREKGECWPGNGKIASEMGLSRDCVIKTIAKLEGRFIKKAPPSNNRPSNTYIVLMDKLVAASVAKPVKKPKRGKLAVLKALRKAEGCRCKGRTCNCETSCFIPPCSVGKMRLVDYVDHFLKVHKEKLSLNSEGEVVGESVAAEVSKEEMDFLDESKATVLNFTDEDADLSDGPKTTTLNFDDEEDDLSDDYPKGATLDLSKYDGDCPTCGKDMLIACRCDDAPLAHNEEFANDPEFY